MSSTIASTRYKQKMRESAVPNSKSNPSTALVFSSCCSVPVEPAPHPHPMYEDEDEDDPAVTCACADRCLVQQVHLWFPPSRELDAAPVAAQMREKRVPKQRRDEQRHSLTSIRRLVSLFPPRLCSNGQNCSFLVTPSANRHRQATF